MGRKAKIAELLLFAELSSIFKGDHIKHNDFNNYNDGIGKGVDFKIWKFIELFAIEVKNWRKQNKPYGKDVALKEVIARFDNCHAKHKILIISFIDLLSKPSLDLLKRHGIQVFSVDRLIGKKVFRSRFFYQLKTRLTEFFEYVQQQAQPRFFINKLTSYSTINQLTSYSITNYNINIEHMIDTIIRQHDTLTVDQLIVSSKVNEAIENFG